MKHTKEYAETIAATKYLYSQTEDSDLFIKAQEWCIDAYANGYMKAIEETNVAGLLEALKTLKQAYISHCDKPSTRIILEIDAEIKKSE